MAAIAAIAAQKLKNFSAAHSGSKRLLSPMAAPASVRVWFRLEGAASADFLDVSSNNNVAQLRKAIYAELKAKLEPRGVIASDLVLSTAGKTYDDEEATVPTVHQTKKDALIVTGMFVRAARSPFAAAAYGRYGPRSSRGFCPPSSWWVT
jgi:hypothetical protein